MSDSRGEPQAGGLIVLCGLGHSIGALVQTAPHYAGSWFGWALWKEQNNDPLAMSHTTAAFWYSVYSFGLPLLLIGVIVLWLDRRGITPPPFIAWSVAAWTVIGTVLSGFSPLLFLLVAAALLLVGGRRSTQHQHNMG
ncbi:DUF6463 family protein [Actinokineospora xionganensis]|uniref:Uncharacterized protein n=1 Tax=Actinokineospora xionganensis TaxID=2684470 RepID=A0ABR7LA34_9PSEU|nr:DUF6463 family protein [Actinokineospora xionganensis]MBC6449561.1 hypothetical protein [Actinokineospora xionganensis]